MGLHLILHEPFNTPRINEQSIAIQPGVEAYVSIEKHIVKSLSKPYSDVNCLLENESKNFKYKTGARFAKYTYENCMFDCMLYYTVEPCNCTLTIQRNGSCTMEDAYFCMADLSDSYYSKCNCPRPCEETTYSYQLTTLQLPTPQLTAQLRAQNFTFSTQEAIRQNLIVLSIFYPSLHYFATEQVEAFTFDELISNLGGQLGLFLGASLMTMMELLEGLTLIGCAWYRRKMKQQTILPK